jgi:predicted RNA binding protein YcfA (HicA-like mRNA interferase family)
LREQVDSLLLAKGFKLARQRKHLVWRHPDGRVWTVPATPSDKRGLLNNFTDLRNFLKRGKVTGSFGFTSISDAEREEFERTLHPATKPKVKTIRERNIGIAIDRVKRPVAGAVLAKAVTRVSAPDDSVDAYKLGRYLEQTLRHNLSKFAEREVAAHEDDVRNNIAPRFREEFRKLSGFSDEELRAHMAKHQVEREVEEFRAAINQVDINAFIERKIDHEIKSSRALMERLTNSLCRASVRFFQKTIRQIDAGIPVDGATVQDSLRQICRKHNDNQPETVIEFLSEFIFASALFVLNPTSLEGATLRIRDNVTVVIEGRVITPAVWWDDHIAKDWDGVVDQAIFEDREITDAEVTDAVSA